MPQPTRLRGLGYLKVQTRDIDRWGELIFDALGMAKGSGPNPEAIYGRLDERRARLIVVPGDEDVVLAIGWEVRDQFALADVREAVEKAGLLVQEMSDKDCDDRGVEAGITFNDPSGTPVEVFFGPVLDHSPLITAHGQRFVTGDQGMGHVVLPTTHFPQMVEFYTEVLGFMPRGSMKMGTPPGMPAMRVRFFGINQRHHSLAMCPAPHEGAPKMVHLMVEVDSLDAVGRALDRVGKDKFSVSSTLGRHTNDKMVSFYVRAPGGWDIEYGCEGMKVDETYYTAEEITQDSYWGHDWSGSEPLAAFTMAAPPASGN